MQLEEAKERLHTKIKVNNACVKEARKNGDINAMQLTADLDEESIAIETVLQALDNSIPKQVVKDILVEINKKEKEELKGLKGQDRYFVKQMYQNQRKSLEELLEGK